MSVPPAHGLPLDAPPASAEALKVAEGLSLLDLAMDEDLCGIRDFAPGTTLGNYHLHAKLGEGGFGVVWRAQQTAPVVREVALKILRSATADPEVIARFQQEQSLLARMTHPGIATVFDAGQTEEGLPYLIMEMVRGVPITQYCLEKKLDFRSRIQLMLDVCRAVQHAHEKAILHRDLKPSNILVTEVDGRPLPKVIDFGISQRLAGTDNASSHHPRERSTGVLGTPNYMAPEELSIEGSVPDVRADVYSLGVILFEVITGAPGELAGRPSTIVLRNREAAVFSSKLPRHAFPELDWINLKALEKDPVQRYPTVAALANDLERMLRHEPLSVGPAGLWYPFVKLVQRRRALFTIGTVATFSLAGLTVMAVQNYRQEIQAHRQAERLRLLAEAESHRANEALEFLSGLLKDAASEVSRGKNPEALLHALGTASTKVTQMNGQPELQTMLAGRLGEVYDKMDAQRPAQPLIQLQVGLLSQAYGADDERTLEALMKLAASTRDGGDRQKAAELFQQVAERLEGSGRQDTPLAFSARQRQADMLSQLDRNQEALVIMRALQYRRDEKGKPATESTLFMRTLAEMQVRQGDFDGARTTLQAILNSASKGPKGRVVRTRTLSSLTGLEARADRRAEALLYARECIAGSEDLAAHNSSEMMDTFIGMSRIHARYGETDEALKLIWQAEELAKRAGNSNQQVHAVMAEADVCESSKRHEGMLLALDKEEKLRRADHTTPLEPLLYLQTRKSSALTDLQRHEEAEKLVWDAWEQIKAHPAEFQAQDTRETFAKRFINISERIQVATGSPQRNAALIREWREWMGEARP